MRRGGRDVNLDLETPPIERSGYGSLASLAEERRRAGDPAEALRIAHDALDQDPDDVAARATAALAALDLGDDASARILLEAVVAAPAPEPVALAFDAIGETELEDAFADAEPEAAAMRDANQVAYDAIRAAELDAPEGVIAPGTPASPFHTRTMAALLERQGDVVGAHSIRASLAQRERREPAEPTSGGRRRSDRIRILERWLGRTRRGDA